MAGLPSLEDNMAAEIKADMAERYFGFRKLIEDEKLDLEHKIKEYSFILQKRISFDLIRIYILLHDGKLIQDFLDLANLNERLFYDPYLTESENIAQRVFECQRFSGLTRFSRFKNYAFDCYENLLLHAELYARKVKELQWQQGEITAEIDDFYHNNDISAIMGFLRALENIEISGNMQGGMETGLAEGLDKKLHIEPPLPIEQVLPVLPPLTPLTEIKKKFKHLLRRAWGVQPPERIAMFALHGTTCVRREVLRKDR